MLNKNFIQRTFVRQISTDDCGPACLSMIGTYIGHAQLARFSRTVEVPEGGLSLLALRNISRSADLPCECVELDFLFLRTMKMPCILFMKNEAGDQHFQVCYGGRRAGKSYKFLMADPAGQVYYLKESDLDSLWPSRAALYFTNTKALPKPVTGWPWDFNLPLEAIPSGIFITVPIVSLCVASFGIALTWVLQKGLNDPSILQGKIVIAILMLLLIISLFKSAFSFLNQYLLINISSAIGEHLTTRFIERAFSNGLLNSIQKIRSCLTNTFKDIQKIQTGITAFIATLLSDGMMMLLLLSSEFYLNLGAGVITLLTISIAITIALYNLPAHSLALTKLEQASNSAEKLLIADLQAFKNNEELPPRNHHLSNYRENFHSSKKIAINSGKLLLYVEAIGAISVISVFSICLVSLQQNKISYNGLIVTVIITYLHHATIPRLCAAFSKFNDALNASLQFELTVSA